MPITLLMMLLGAQSAASDEPADDIVLILDLKGDARAGTRQTVDGLLASEVQTQSLSVITERDMKRAVDLESDRAAMGCDDDSCLAELAGAFDATMVIFGNLGVLDGVWVLSLNLFDSRAGRSRARKVVTVDSTSKFPGAIAQVVPELLGRAPVAVENERASPSWLLGGIVAGVGATGVLALGGAALLFDGSVAEAGISSVERDQRRGLGIASLAGAALSGAAVVVGASMIALGGE